MSWNNCDVASPDPFTLPIDHHFDLSLENDKRLFIRVSMFLGSTAGREMNHKEGKIGFMFKTMEGFDLSAGRFQAIDIDGLH